MDLTNLDIDLVRGELSRRSLKTFVQTFWNVVEPSTPFQDGYHIDAICDHLSHVWDIRKLIINIPPRHTKSLLVAVFFPAWLWLHAPSTRLLCCSYSLQLSIRDSVKCRRLIESPLYKKCFGDIVQLSGDQNQKQKFENNRTGYRLATSIESGNTGEGGSVIFDDPNNVQECNSEAERNKVITFWREVLSTRLNDPARDFRIVIQQRCHTEDLSGYILESDSASWCKLVLPFEHSPERTCVTSLGWKDPREKEGEPLSGRIPPDEVRYLKRSLGTAAWHAQYNQNPRPSEGAVFKAEWLRYYEETADAYALDGRTFRKEDCWRFGVCDLAISEKASADYTVIQTYAVTPDQDLLLVHQTRDRIGGTRLIPTLATVYQQFGLNFIGIEDVAFQRLVLQQARQEGLTVKPLKPQGDKLSRSFAAQVRMEQGQVWFPRGKAWLDALEDELLSFPNGKHDDQCDCISYAALLMNRFGKAAPKAEAAPEKTDEQRRWEMMWGD